VAQPASNETMMSYKRGKKKKKTTQAVKTTPHINNQGEGATLVPSTVKHRKKEKKIRGD